MQLFFLIISISGIGAGIYLIYEIIYPQKDWVVQIEGKLKPEYKKDIQDTVYYFLKINQNRVNEQSLEEILTLNPRINKILKINISPYKRNIEIEVQLKKTAYIYHNTTNYQFQEISLEQQTIEENIKNFHQINQKIPILCLTHRQNLDDSTFRVDDQDTLNNMKRDITSLFLETKEYYAFVWHYISEICLSNGYYRYTIYSNHTHTRIQTNTKFDIALLRRFWAVFYYLEKNFKNKTTEIKLNKYNAHIKTLTNLY